MVLYGSLEPLLSGYNSYYTQLLARGWFEIEQNPQGAPGWILTTL